MIQEASLLVGWWFTKFITLVDLLQQHSKNHETLQIKV